MKPFIPSHAIEPMSIKPSSEDPIRVMIVDDSAVVRSLLKSYLDKEKDILVVASSIDGEMALGHLKRHDVEVVLLDLFMPKMDGLSALPKMLEMRPDLQVIVVTGATDSDTVAVMQAMDLGAVDGHAKPSTTSELNVGLNFKRELLGKIRAWGEEGRKKRPNDKASVEMRNRLRDNPLTPRLKSDGPVATPAYIPYILRVGSIPRPDAIAIGSSTGGPQALFSIIPHLKNVTQPVFITQHMPAAFTGVLADHITKLGSLPCIEAEDGMPVEGGKIYLARGDHHMTISSGPSGKVIRLTKDKPENFCRPAVDPMLRSLAIHYTSKLFILILTGMGVDGLKGGEVALQSGASMIAQDQESSVVWGMPGAVAQAGLCHDVLPLEEIGPYIASVARMGKPA